MLLAFSLVGLLCSACTSLNLDGDDETVDGIDLALNPLLLSGPDGIMSLNATYYPNPPDVPGCVEVVSHTKGKDVWDSLWLSFCFPSNAPVGQEIAFERFGFSAALSSNSFNHTSEYTGRIVLKEKSDKRVVIHFDNIHLSIAHGEYTLKGYMVAKTSH